MAVKKRLADYGLQSERVMWHGKGPGVFETEIGDLEQALMTTTLDRAVRWAQTKSMWPDQFGLSCCAMEMIAIVGSRYDIARFGMEAFRASPRQADLLIVSGRVSHKMAAPLRQIYDQMLEPKWVIAMGACASSGGMFNNYAVLQGVDKIVAVDIHVPGCPPRPEALMEGIVRLHEKVAAGVPPASKPKRFSMNYHLLRLDAHATRVRVQVWLDDGEPVPSVVPVWPTADWHEREAWDMMGIRVEGHPNLKRILMEDDWEGHPLRKDYPIGGEPVRFSGEE